MPDNKNPKVDAIFAKAKQWQDEFAKLRTVALSTKLTEDVKWGQACYTLDGHNVVLIHGFKEYCALLFFKGALLKDPDGLLIQQTANVQSARQIRFTSAKDIKPAVLKSYIQQAIEVEKAGLKVDLKKTGEFAMPDEFKARLKDAKLKKAFEALTPGRQRAYLLHFGGAKQAATREARIDKCTPMILAGKGLND